jgi:hypothetical protein
MVSAAASWIDVAPRHPEPKESTVFRIIVSIREKRSTATQFENASVGCDIEANNLELTSPEAIVEKTKQLFVLARSAVQQQLLSVVPEQRHPVTEHANGNGNGHAAPKNGNGRSYGRPQPEPTPKQRVLLQKLAKERGLSADQVGEIARRECGRSVPQLDRNGLSKLIDFLMQQEATS